MNLSQLASLGLRAGLIVLIAAAAVGCASSRTLPVYRPGQVNQARTNELGTVNSVRAVIIERDPGVRTSAGARAGSSLGRAVATGQNPAAAIAGAAGSVVGEIAGRAIETLVTRVEGQEVEVRLDDGSTVTVVQENNPPFLGGERVRLIRTGTHVEVVADGSYDTNRYAGP
jgi:outer membrane lipoprotein SlyB